MITYQESIKLIENLNIKASTTERVSIDNAIGRIIAVNIIASENNPKYLTSAMDGYAIKFDDIESDSIEIIDINPAGSIVKNSVTNNNCIKTFTGSLMPEGSDTLVPIENVEVIGNSIKIVEKVSQGFAVRAIGENYSKGEVLISKDSKIDFAHIGVLASLNIPFISVYKKPIVTVLSTGSEILDVGDIETNQSQIRSSNHFTIEAIAKKYGASVNQAGVITDDYNNIKNKIKDALKNSDIVVTTGGVSVGDYDFVKDIIKVELNAEIIFKGVKIKPGQHIVLAKTIDDRYILGLPGFAYSSTVTALIYLTKLIKLFLNQKSSLPIREAIIENDINRMTGKTEFRVANLNYQDGEYRVNFDNKKVGTSAILTNMIGNQITLVEFSPTDKNIKQGEKVKIIIL